MVVFAQALLFAAAWCGSLSLLVQTGQHTQPTPEDLADKRTNKTFELSVLLPSVHEYRRTWVARHKTDRRRSEPMPESIKMVMGLFTIPQERDYRVVVRETWLNQTGVCSWEVGPHRHCSVYVAFVMCSEGWGMTHHRNPLPVPLGFKPEDLEAAHQEPGVLLLNTTENMNDDKTTMWFQTALRKFDWATHIAKMDMDTFPFMHKLVYRMARGPCGGTAGRYEYIGWPGYWKNTGPFQGACPPSTHDQCVMSPQQVWDHMTGQLYALAKPLAALIPWGEVRHVDGEDIQVARAVADAIRTHGICVTPRALDSWYHGFVRGGPGYHSEGESSPGYANEL